MDVIRILSPAQTSERKVTATGIQCIPNHKIALSLFDDGKDVDAQGLPLTVACGLAKQCHSVRRFLV